MAIKKKKISELTLSDNLKGLYTIGVKLINGVQTSVKVSLEYIQTAYENAVKATNSANEAAKSANNAASSANTATSNANKATEAAKTATNNANEATQQAKTATSNANLATQKANTAATNADNARKGLEEIKSATESATANANKAATNANEKAQKAETAAKKAEDAAKLANEKATAADSAAGKAVEATNNANAKANEAHEKAEEANTAKDNANEATGDARVVIARLEELEESLISKYKLIPTSMKLNYPKKVTYRNTQPFKVEVELLPVDTGRNVLFLGDDRAVSITPDGVFMINGVGMSKIHVIPTENTGIYQTIQIEVQEPGIRLTSGNGMRLSGSGGIILT